VRLRAFLAGRRREIRKRLFGSHRASYFLLNSGLEGEAPKGWVFAVPALFALATHAPLPVVLPLIFVAIPGIAYAMFALAVGYKAYAEWGDRLYDKHTRKLLPTEYRETESATAARRKRQAEPRS